MNEYDRRATHTSSPILPRQSSGSARGPLELFDGQRAEHPRGAVAGGLAEERVGAGFEGDGDRTRCPWPSNSPAASTGPLPLAPCSPASMAMLCVTPDMLGISIVTAPGAGRGLVGDVGQLTAGVGFDRELAGLLDGGLARAGRLRRRSPAGRCPCPGAAPPGRRRRRCRAASRPLARSLGIAPFGVGDTGPGLRRRRGSWCARGLRRRCAEGFVEVGPDDALGVRARERVAGAAFGDELLLAVDQVGVVGALDRAASAHGEREPRTSAHRADAARAHGARCAGGRAGLAATACSSWAREHYPKGGRLGQPLAPTRPAPSGALQSSSSPRAAAITPARRRSQDQRSRTVATSPSRACSRSCRSAPSQPTRRSASAGTASSSTGKESQRAACAGTARGELLADLGQPRMRGADRQRAARRRLRGDHPEGLREGARHDQRLARGQQLGELLVIQAPGEDHALAAARRACQVALAPPRPAGRRGTRAGGASGPARGPAASPSSARDRPARAAPRAPLEVACARAPSSSARSAIPVGAEADDHQPRPRPRSSTSGQAASSRSTPLLTISLPTNATERSRSGSRRASAAAAAPGSRCERAARAATGVAGSAPGSRSARACQTARGGRRARAAGTLARPRPAGPDGCARAARVLASARHRLSAVWREPTSTPARRRRPSRAKPEEALGLGLDRVLERAAVDLDRVGHRARQRAREDHRAHHEVVGQRDLAAPRSAATSATAATLACDVARDLLVAALRERARLDALVAVGHVHRQQPADVRAVDRAARLARRAPAPHPAGAPAARPASQSPAASTNGVVLGVALLAEQVNLVAEPHQRVGQAGVVDVGPGAAEQVAVEDQDAHRRQPTCAADGLR